MHDHNHFRLYKNGQMCDILCDIPRSESKDARVLRQQLWVVFDHR